MWQHVKLRVYNVQFCVMCVVNVWMSPSGLHGVMAWPVFCGIICCFSFCSDLCHIDTHTHTCAQPQYTVEGWSQWQSSLQDNRWTKGTRRGECQAKKGAGCLAVGVKGDSWRGLMGDEMAVAVVSGWPWPLCGGQMGCEGHRPWGRRMKSREG